MRKVIVLSAGAAAVDAARLHSNNKAETGTASCSTEHKQAMSRELLNMANSTISDSRKDVQWLFLLTKKWDDTKNSIAKHLPNMTPQLMDQCRKENMSYFLELFAKRKIALTKYPQVKQKNQQPAALLQQGKSIVDKVVSGKKKHTSSFAQTGTKTEFSGGAQVISGMPDLTKNLMKRHTQTAGLITGLKATVASMAQMNTMPKGDANVAVNNTVIDQKITKMLHMNGTANLNGELSSLVAGLSSSLTTVDKEVPQRVHHKTETEMMLEELEKEDSQVGEQTDDMLGKATNLGSTQPVNLMGGEALNIGTSMLARATGLPGFEERGALGAMPKTDLMGMGARQDLAPPAETPAAPQQQPPAASHIQLQASPHLSKVEQAQAPAVPSPPIDFSATLSQGQQGVNLAPGFSPMAPMEHYDLGQAPQPQA